MDNLNPTLQSDEVRAAIEKSTDFSRTLYRLQPETILLPSLSSEDDDQIKDSEIRRLRVTVSSALFFAAMDHHVALILLLRNNMRSSAFALLRVIFDATWRGAWATYIASDQNLNAFIVGRYDPKPEPAIRQLEQKHVLPAVLSIIYANGWSAMSAFTHGGALQVQRWIGEAVIEPRHTDAEVREVLDIADRLAFTACVFALDVARVDLEDLPVLAKNYFG